jgi:hypothetical protein
MAFVSVMSLRFRTTKRAFVGGEEAPKLRGPSARNRCRLKMVLKTERKFSDVCPAHSLDLQNTDYTSAKLHLHKTAKLCAVF